MRPSVLVLLACTGCSTFVQHRAALVPHATPVQNIGRPNTWRTAVSLGASNAVDLQAPGVGDPDAGVAIPAQQMRGAFTLAVTRNFSLSYAMEQGLASSAQPVKPTLPPLDDKPVTGHGPSATYSFALDPAWRLGITVEILGWSVPWVEYTSCIDNCAGQPNTVITHDTTAVLTGALGIVPSYHVQGWTFFGGLTVRNHPTIVEKVISNGFSSDVEDGPANAIAHAGVAYDASDRVRFLVETHQTLTRDPVAYAPAIGFSFELGLGPAMREPATAVAPLPRDAASRRSEARRVYAEAHRQAEAGECPKVRELAARVHELDAGIYQDVLVRDRLVAYCLTP